MGKGKAAALHQAAAAEQVELGDQPLAGGRERRVAGEVEQPVVEFKVERVIAVDIARRHRLAHALDQPAQGGNLPVGDAAGECLAGQAVERRAHGIDVGGFLGRHGADEEAAVLLDPDEPGAFQRAQRLAHRSAADAEPLGQIGFNDLAARRQFAGLDHLQQCRAHQPAQRLLAQDVDDGGGGGGGH